MLRVSTVRGTAASSSVTRCATGSVWFLQVCSIPSYLSPEWGCPSTGYPVRELRCSYRVPNLLLVSDPSCFHRLRRSCCSRCRVGAVHQQTGPGVGESQQKVGSKAVLDRGRHQGWCRPCAAEPSLRVRFLIAILFLVHKAGLFQKTSSSA